MDFSGLKSLEGRTLLDIRWNIMKTCCFQGVEGKIEGMRSMWERELCFEKPNLAGAIEFMRLYFMFILT